MDPMGRAIFIMLFVLMPVGLFIIHRRRRRRNEQRVRVWASEHGYALLRFEYPMWATFFLPRWVRRGCYIKIQDSEGGHRSGWVHFRRKGKMEIRWQ